MKNRVIINTDAKNEADDQFAIVQAMLSPSIDVVGIIAAHFGSRRTSRSMLESRDEIDLVLDLMGRRGSVPVANGAPAAMPDAVTAVPSAGAQMIVDAAREPGALYVLFLGPLTDMAAALLQDPTLVHNRDLIVVWVGGHPYDGVHSAHELGEFNLSNDVHAANVVLQSGLQVWQIPWTVYSMVNVGYAELDEKVAPCGALGAYLVQQLKDFNATHVTPELEMRTLGDSPAVLAAMNPQALLWRHHPVRVFDQAAGLTDVVVAGRTVRVADALDTRFLLEDLFAKLRAHARTRGDSTSAGGSV